MTGYIALALLVSVQAGWMNCDAVRSDARLADVCFVGLQHGWAVGDRGTVWCTDDGGRRWHLQRSGITCPLASVCFIDEQTGWAAGGFSHPYTHSSSGVLLRTDDGGRSWHRDRNTLLPALKQIGMFDAKHGWAVGCPSAMYPTGVFTTGDGGRSWQPLAGEKMTAWLAGDFLNPHTGALAGRDGTVAMVQRGGVQPTRIEGFGLRNLTCLKLIAPVYGWLIGDGGLIMTTADLGASWQTPPGELPDGMARHFDFAAMAVLGPNCWVAGVPGSRVFHTADAGRTWTAAPTGTNLPLYAMTFVDARHGWAVGALGIVIATDDGGQTWRLQRSGGRRAALMGIFGKPTDVPLELLAYLSGNEGYLGVVEVLGRHDPKTTPAGCSPAADRLHEAVVTVGASDTHAAWRFPLPQAGLGLGAERIVELWDRANDARGLDHLHRRLVRQIRLWRPEVIVTHDASPRGDDPLGHVVNQMVLRAIDDSVDATCLPGQITHAGLEPWQVKKVYAALPPPQRGPTELITAKLAARLGCSLADLAAEPRGLLEDRFTVAPPSLGFRLLVNRLPQDRGRRDFFAGIVLHPGGEDRRQLLEPPPEGLDRLRRTAQLRRNMQAILQEAEKNPAAGAKLLAQADTITRGLGSDSAGRLLYQLARQYHNTGRWPLAAELFELLPDRYPDHPLTRPALLWLVQYYAGDESAWRIQGAQRYVVGQTSAMSIDISRVEDRAGRAAQFAKQIKQTRPELFAEPALRFSLAVAHRRQGFPRQAERFYLAQSHSPTHDAWWACASGEQWLAEPRGTPPKQVLPCVRSGAKPRLDGKLDDELWQRAKPAVLKNNLWEAKNNLWEATPSATDSSLPVAVRDASHNLVMLAYDDEFLYIAVNCRCAAGAKYEPADGPRPRDADLLAHDRIDVFLDLDRDFVTYYRLTIDHRGWTGEDCWGDRTWNPTWFVAAASADGRWTAEAAVPLEQLTGRRPDARTVWAVGIQRTIPSVGLQSWSTPASTSVLGEGFGYLIFE